MIDKKSPEEILKLLAQAQSLIDGWTETYVATTNIPPIDLHALMWDVIDDILDSLLMRLSLDSDDNTAEEIYHSVLDYAINYYGED